MFIAWLIILILVEIFNGPENIQLLFWLLLIPMILQDRWDVD